MKYISVVTASMLGTLIAMLIAVFFLFLFVLVMAAGSSATPPVPSRSTLVVPLSGAVPETVSGDPIAQSFLGEPAYGLQQLDESIRRAAEDDRIKSIWLKTGIVSMSWASLETIRAALHAFKESGKPVFASASTYYMSEKEFFVASVADSLFLDPESLFELNGFVASTTHYADLLEKLHVTPQIVRAGSYKSAVETFTRDSMSPENREQLQAMLSDVTDVFVDVVSTARGLDPDAFRRSFATEAVLSAGSALKKGYVDGLLYDDQIKARIAERAGLDDPDDLRETKLSNYSRTVHARSVRSNDEIAVVYAVGTMMPGESADVPSPLFGGGSLGSKTFSVAMKRARDNRRTRAEVLRIDSPGGQVAAADAMLREIRKTAEKMPVVVSMGDVAASGGFWIAMGSQTLVAQPLTITGSIGVFSLFFDMSGLFEDHLGISFDDVTTNPYADMLSGMRPYRAEELRLMEAYTDETYQSFLQLVADGRGMSVEDVIRLAGGRIWTGRAAEQNGLVDRLGGLRDAIAEAAEQAGLSPDSVAVRTYPAPRSFLERFMGQSRIQMARLGLISLQEQLQTEFEKRSELLSAAVQAQGRAFARVPVQFDIR